MMTVVRENGNRPTLTTPARLNADAGAKVLADLMAPHDFADLCAITLDWEGDGFTPVMVIDTIKWFPHFNGRSLSTHQVISIDDAFGMDNYDNALARQIVYDLREEFERMSQTTPPGWS